MSRVYGIEVTISNAKRLIAVGFIAELQLADAPGHSVATVPLEAVVKPPSGPGEYAVYVLDDQNGRPVARLRPVKLGEALGQSFLSQPVDFVIQGPSPPELAKANGIRVVLAGVAPVALDEPRPQPFIPGHPHDLDPMGLVDRPVLLP